MAAERYPAAEQVPVLPTNQVAMLEQATRMLAECRTLDEAKQIHDLAAAARVYAREAELGFEAQNYASEIKLRAERRVGEILRQMAEQGERAVQGRPEQTSPPVTIGDLGIEPNESSRWQKLALIPKQDFEDYITAAKEAEQPITLAGALRGKVHVSHNSGENEWYTPADYIEAARFVLGEIDLDPASTEEANQIVGARRFFSIENDGLAQEWQGRVWMNPPYAGDLIGEFTGKLARHFDDGAVTAALMLVNNATETDWFQQIARRASAICFPARRVRFWSPDGGTGAPLQGQAILYLGPNLDSFVAAYERFGLILYAQR